MSLVYSNARLVRLAIITLLMVVMIGIAMPASATPPEELNFEYDILYSDLPARFGYGTWGADGVFAGEGDLFQDPNHSGWDPEGCWRTVHSLETLTDENGDTITIRGQLTKIEGQPSCLSFTAEVNWVIIDGTGAYEGLHGQGQGDASGYMVFNNGQLDYVLHIDLFGQGHFDYTSTITISRANLIAWVPEWSSESCLPPSLDSLLQRVSILKYAIIFASLVQCLIVKT